MVEILGLTGYIPKDVRIVTPPYDIITPKLHKLLLARNSLVDVISGGDPQAAFKEHIRNEDLVEAIVPSFYLYEQTYNGTTRIGVFVSAEVGSEIIQHEGTFPDKVRGRVDLREKTRHSFGPVFTYTEAGIGSFLESIRDEIIEYEGEPLFEFTSDFEGLSDMDGIHNRVFQIDAESKVGRELSGILRTHPLYIIDGHHRYQAARGRQSHFLAYVTDQVTLQAYNRVIKGMRRFEEIKRQFNLEEVDEFKTPEKHQVCIYSGGQAYLLDIGFGIDRSSIAGQLDCNILEEVLYEELGLTKDMKMDPERFGYYPESQLKHMMDLVNNGDFDLAVALNPVLMEELLLVANAGLIMPEKSTYAFPKILTGLIIAKLQSI